MIWRLAGAVGVDPDPRTLRELAQMYEGRSRERWEHTSLVVATILNVNRAKGRAAIKPSAVNPWECGAGGRRIALRRDNIGELKKLLPDAARQ